MSFQFSSGVAVKGRRRIHRRFAAVGASVAMTAALVASAVPGHTSIVAGGEPGGIEFVTAAGARATHAAEDGPWTAARSGNADVQLAIRADGTLQQFGATAHMPELPSHVVGKQVRSADIFSFAKAAAVFEDGSMTVWGLPAGLLPGTFTPEDLVGGEGEPSKGVQTAQAGAVNLTRLEDGRVSLYSPTTGAPEIVKDWDTDEILTGAVDVTVSGAFGFILCDDGSVIRVNAAGDLLALAPANAEDPIVQIENTFGLRQSGQVVTWTNTVENSVVDLTSRTPAIAGNIVELAAAGGNVLVRSDQGNVEAWIAANGLLIDLPSDVQGRVLAVSGSNSAATNPFALIVGDSDEIPGLGVDANPIITGTPQVAETLTGTPATFTGDPDSITNQWFADDDPIDGATGSTLLLTEAELGKVITFVSTAAKEGVDSVTSKSDPTDPVQAAALTEITNTAPPAITGTPQVGEILTASDGTWTPEDVTLAHQWLRDGEEIADATDSSYELTGDDEGARISVRVTANKDDLDSVSVTSAETEPVAAAPVEDIVNDTAPAITGTAKVGETLTASAGEWTPSDADLAYQWLRNGEAIGSATNYEYTLVAADQGSKISVQVTATKSGYNSANATSAETAEVAPADLAVTSVPVISGTPQEGHTLLGTAAMFNDASATVTNQWYADGEAISGATENTLLLTADHVDAMITFKSTATRGDDSISATSAPSGPVAAADVPLSVTTPATLSGTPLVGQTLTATAGEFGGDIDNVTHEWLADGEVLSGATGTSLVLTADHVGKTITFRSTAVRGENSLESVSDPVGPVLVVLAATSDPSISGTAEVGQTLTGTPAVFNDTAAAVTNQWYADGVALSGATGSTLVLTADHLGAAITFKSTATRGSDTVTAESEATDAVKLKALEVTSSASISGTAQVGETLTGTPAEFNDSSATVSNQWYADGEALTGETGTTLALTEDHVGARITFVSTATRGDDALESSSAATAAVAPETPDEGGEGGISLPEEVAQGETVTVNVGEEYAGEEVEVWMFSTPRVIGSGTVSAGGTIAVTIPADAELGDHTVAVYLMSGELIGFQGITVVAADGSGGGSGAGAGSGSAGAGTSTRALTRTGMEIGKTVLPIGAVLLVLGGVALVAGRRQRMN